METYHEMDERGFHRIVVDGQASSWVSYPSLPSLEVNGVRYFAASGYWEGTLPIECVMSLSVVSNESREFHGIGENPIQIKR